VLKKAGVEVLFKAMGVLDGSGLPDNGIRKAHREGATGVEPHRVGVGEVHLNNLLKKNQRVPSVAFKGKPK